MMFFEVGDSYDGKVKTDACIINGGMVKSTVQFNGVYTTKVETRVGVITK